MDVSPPLNPSIVSNVTFLDLLSFLTGSIFILITVKKIPPTPALMDLQKGKEKYEEMWHMIRKDAEAFIEEDPYTGGLIHTRVLSLNSLSESLAQILSVQLGSHNLPTLQMQNLLHSIYEDHKEVLYSAALDLFATYRRDPACNSPLEALLLFKGFQALQAHRAAHVLWQNNRKLLAKIIQSSVSRAFCVDIHPAAQIGCCILIDHATNIVVGETAQIGNNVSILHGVTLGGTGSESGDRHPKIGDGVLISAHAQLLGNISIGENAKIGSGAVVLDDVPPHTTYAGIPARQVGVPRSSVPAIDMLQNFSKDQCNM